MKRVKVWSFVREHAERSIQTMVSFGENLWNDRKSGHFGENMWGDPTGGHDWSERVERSNVWSFEGGLRERLKVRSYVMPCTFGGNLWSDRKSDHYGENMRSDPTGGPNRRELMK